MISEVMLMSGSFVISVNKASLAEARLTDEGRKKNKLLHSFVGELVSIKRVRKLRVLFPALCVIELR